MDKKFQLPKDGIVEPEGRVPNRLSDEDDAEGHRLLQNQEGGSDDLFRRDNDGSNEDVEGHGLPLTPPPSFSGSRRPGHGGENIPSPVDEDDDDVEGHRVAPFR